MQDTTKAFPFGSRLSLKPLFDYLKKNAHSFSQIMPCEGSTFENLLEQAPELGKPIDDLSVLKQHDDLVKRIMSLVFPPVFWDTEPVGALVPFSMQPFWLSPRFKALFFSSGGEFTPKLSLDLASFQNGRVIRVYLAILKKFYGIQQDLDYPIIYAVADPKTGLERHYRLQIDLRFVNIRALRKPKPLSDEDREFILDNLDQPQRLKKLVPPQNFELTGFTVVRAVDVTNSEVLSALERDLIDQESIISKDGFLRIQERLRALFRQPKLVAGLAAIQEDQVLLLNSGSEMARHCIFADSKHIRLSEFKDTVYGQAVNEGAIKRVSDISSDCACCNDRMKAEFSRRNIRSLLVAPLFYKGRCLGTLDIGVPQAGDLSPMDAMLLSRLQPLFSMAVKKALDDLENSIQGVIKEKCTAIHPTVEWRFRKAAITHLENLHQGRESSLESIVFKDVYPLYGVSDIRGSTRERNKAIGKDLTEHLKLALAVVDQAATARPLLALNEIAGRIKDHMVRLEGRLRTDDEVLIINFLQQDVESLFTVLEDFGPKVLRAIKQYRSRMDENVGSIYRRRKDFEESVAQLNNRLAAYLDQEEAAVQNIFPHYFERHRTDGLDYLIYIGDSLLESGRYDPLYLKNLRLWQIQVAAGMAWHTEQLKASLKIPLDTAHLVLIQNTPLSIRFRFDEKRFDVDGAYDIRQEIIKSRIDKAVVKGGAERLTQPGKIAIVYSHGAEAQEVLRHIDFLQKQGYLTGTIENLDLEDLPGVQGLKSIRVDVDLESNAFSQDIKRLVA